METKIVQIITALFELEAKGCHRTYFEYEKGMFRVKIASIKTNEVIYGNTIKVAEERKELKKTLNHIITMKNCIMKFPYQCYKRVFVKGVKAGEWEKTDSIIEYGEKATVEKAGNGLFISDFESGLQYFVDYKQINKKDK